MIPIEINHNQTGALARLPAQNCAEPVLHRSTTKWSCVLAFNLSKFVPQLPVSIVTAHSTSKVLKIFLFNIFLFGIYTTINILDFIIFIIFLIFKNSIM